MAITLSQIERAMAEKRIFYWEYDEDKGYILYGQLPSHHKPKVIGHTKDWRNAETVGNHWLCQMFGYIGQWQELIILINRHETPQAPKHYQSKVKNDKTLDLFNAKEPTDDETKQGDK